jgi:hypothetical protein
MAIVGAAKDTHCQLLLAKERRGEDRRGVEEGRNGGKARDDL